MYIIIIIKGLKKIAQCGPPAGRRRSPFRDCTGPGRRSQWRRTWCCVCSVLHGKPIIMCSSGPRAGVAEQEVSCCVSLCH